MQSIRGKLALVTGAASGLGRALALALANEGANLELWDIDQDGLDKIVAETQALGVEATGRRCDISQKGQISACVQGLLTTHGHLDILVNNAGVAFYGPTETMTAAQWDWLLSINLWAPIQLVQEFLPTLLSRPEAHILNMCSISGMVASGRFAAYHVSKYGLIGLSEALRAEYGRRMLGVTALCPGPVLTNLYKSAVSGRAEREVPSPPKWLCTTPEKVAKKGIRAIYKDKGLVLVSPMAYGLYYLKRTVPWALDLMGQLSRKKWKRRKELKRQAALAAQEAATKPVERRAA